MAYTIRISHTDDNGHKTWHVQFDGHHEDLGALLDVLRSKPGLHAVKESTERNVGEGEYR